MALTQRSLGSDVTRAGLKVVYFAEAKKIASYVEDTVANDLQTTDAYERFKTLIGLGPAEETNEGEPTKFDDYSPLFSRNFTPVRYTKGVKYTDEASYTVKYGIIKGMIPAIARSFTYRKNMVSADLDNLGFSNTTMGMNNEPLYSLTHANNGFAGSNMSSTNAAFSPQAVAAMRAQMSAQVSARGLIMPFDGRIIVKVPTQLQATAWAIENSEKLIGTNYNDANYAKYNTSYKINPFYTSPTAWFARAADADEVKTFLLQQLKYDIRLLPPDDTWQTKWVSRESYTVGWYHWYFTWGSVGQ